MNERFATSAQLSNGLEVYWKFNNNFQDTSGNGYDLTPSNNTVGFRPDGGSGRAILTDLGFAISKRQTR